MKWLRKYLDWGSHDEDVIKPLGEDLVSAIRGLGNPVLGELKVESSYWIPDRIASYRCYGVTNETEGKEVLKDLTGNGHDILLKNFAFSEGSGYGKYLNNYTYLLKSKQNVEGTTFNNRINITKVINDAGTSLFYHHCPTTVVLQKEHRVKVSGLKKGESLKYVNTTRSFNNSNYKGVILNENKEYILPPLSKDENDIINNNWGGFISNGKIDSCNITIEQIPDYKGALVSDGVDDEGYCNNMPLFNKKKGFTYILIRKKLDFGIPRKTFLHKGDGINTSSLLLEFTDSGTHYGTRIFGNTKFYSSENDLKNLVTAITSKSIDGTPIVPGNNPDGNILYIFRASSSYPYWTSYALYALDIYDRDLTDEEIEAVKAEMMEEFKNKTNYMILGRTKPGFGKLI